MKKMKKCILLLLATFVVSATLAQDLIVKTDSTRIEAVVHEISTEQVRYKRYARPDGPTYVLPVAQICYIRYSDGFIENYNRAKPQTAVAATTSESEADRIEEAKIDYPVVATPQPQPVLQPAPAVQQVAEDSGDMRFEVGQYYDYNGVRGIVCITNEEGTHGLIISLNEVMIEWSTFRKEELRKVGATDQHDGAKNMEAVADYIAKNNLTWDHFPAFKWCREKGEGWYLPAIDELLTIGNNYNGGNRQHNNRQCRTRWNENMKTAGGDRLDLKRIYYSSSELNAPLAMMAHMSIEVPYLYNMHEDTPDPIQKYVTFLVRAVHKF